MSAEVAFLRGMVLRVDEDCIVRASCHAGLATYADGLVEIHYSVWALMHGTSRTCCNTGRIRALVAPGYLKSPPGVREGSNVHRLHVSSGDPQGNFVFGLASSSASMTSNAASLVDDLCPCQAFHGHAWMLRSWASQEKTWFPMELLVCPMACDPDSWLPQVCHRLPMLWFAARGKREWRKRVHRTWSIADIARLMCYSVLDGKKFGKWR